MLKKLSQHAEDIITACGKYLSKSQNNIIMEITLHKITIGELAKGYVDNQDAGVKAYGGLLDVRPPYQREFVYNDKEREAVIDTVTKDYPLGVMYW